MPNISLKHRAFKEWLIAEFEKFLTPISAEEHDYLFICVTQMRYDTLLLKCKHKSTPGHDAFEVRIIGRY